MKDKMLLYNTLAIVSYFVLKLTDFITTHIALVNGFVELNPFALLDPILWSLGIGLVCGILILANIFLKKDRGLVGFFLVFFNAQGILVLMFNFKII